MMKQAALLIAAVALTAGTAYADSYTYSAKIAPFGMDGGGDGSSTTPSLVVDHTFALPDIVSLDSIMFQLSHDYLSDLHIELTDPNGVTYIIAQGNGPSGGPFGGNTFDGSHLGDGTPSLDAVLDYYFVESGGNTWNDGMNPGVIMSSGNYNALNWVSGSFAAGDWNIKLWDAWDTADGGAIGDIVVYYTPVPAPGALALLGLAGLAGSRRRRA